MSKIVVIGGGASGIIASLRLSKNNEVILVDANEKIGKKLLITGNGRCNYWNSNINIQNYYTDDYDTLTKILNYSNDTLKYLYNLLIYPKIKDGYYYPHSNQASSIVKILTNEIEKSNIKIINNFKVKNIDKNKKFVVESIDGKTIECDKVVISTGSVASKIKGSSNFGYDFLKKQGHKINSILPALVPLTSNNKNISLANGVRVDGKVTLYINDKKIKESIGEIQFTDYGVSGICIFNLSSIVSKNLLLKNKVYIEINFLNDLDDNFYNWFDEKLNKYKNYTISEILESILNYKLINFLFKSTNINKNTYCKDLCDDDKNKIIELLTKFKINIIDTLGFDRAQVCTGGVSINEINPSNMESKLIPNLYITGEVLDVDGICGGFNLAFAFITGYIVGGISD